MRASYSVHFIWLQVLNIISVTHNKQNGRYFEEKGTATSGDVLILIVLSVSSYRWMAS